MTKQRDPLDRFIDKIVPTSWGCWLWTGKPNSEGYGRFTVSTGVVVRAHRWAYEHWIGPIPDGMVLDHVKARGCRSTMCVNAAHLESVTQAENVARGRAGQPYSDRTHCPQGHEYTEENTYRWRNNRYCRQCQRDRWPERARKRRAA